MGRKPVVSDNGTMRITLSAGGQLALFSIEPFSAKTGLIHIRLAGYANARELMGKASVDAKSLPAAGKVVNVEGVPFEFPGINPEGNDHIDVGQSLLRQANMAGYIPSRPGENARWHGAAMRDPARIQVRIPNGFYDNLYIVAASDGDDNSIPLVSAMF